MAEPAQEKMTAVEPRVAIEVLSPSTTRYDRFRKAEEYEQVPAIRVILLVGTENSRVTVGRREENTWVSHEEPWVPHEEQGLDAVIALPEIATGLPLGELFEGPVFPPPKPVNAP